jgi:asparaginyl-tRNA synthetase
VKSQIPADVWTRFAELTTETSVEITGEARAEPRAPGGFELGVTSLTVVGPSPSDYPIQPKEHGIDFLLDNRHFWLRSPRQRAIAVIRHEVEQGFTTSSTSGDSSASTPDPHRGDRRALGPLRHRVLRGGERVPGPDGQLYGEAAAAAFGKIYTFGPTFRAEKSKTRRHLTEFWMIEPEVAWNDSNANMALQEEFVSYLVQRVLERRKVELAELERDVEKLRGIVPPFPRLNYTDAVALVQRKGSETKWGEDLGAEGRGADRREYDKPVFVFNYPKEAKGLLHEGEPGRSAHGALRRPARAGRLRRDHRRLTARGRLRQARRTPRRRRDCRARRTSGISTCAATAPSRTPASASGLERTVAWICGIQHVREVIAFPRLMHRLTP